MPKVSRDEIDEAIEDSKPDPDPYAAQWERLEADTMACIEEILREEESEEFERMYHERAHNDGPA